MPQVISVELTPNYEARKFRVDGPLGRVFPRAHAKGDDTSRDVYATALLGLPGVTQVYFDLGFFTVNKQADANWDELAIEVKAAVAAVAAEGQFGASAAASNGTEADDPELLRRIEEALDTHIRPHLANDGGGLELVALKDCRLTIRYQGACGGCRSALTGTLFAIENCLQGQVDQRITVDIG